MKLRLRMGGFQLRTHYWNRVRRSRWNLARLTNILRTRTTNFSQPGTGSYSVTVTLEFYTKQMGLPLRTLTEWGSIRLVRP